MNGNEVYEGEVIEIESLIRDKIGELKWRTKEGNFVMLKDMADSHLRNTALMLMGLGYQRLITSEDLKIKWLTAFRMEWERRMIARRNGQSLFRGVNNSL